MTTQTEALKLALEALESSRVFVTSREKIKHPEGTDWYDERISAIKEALQSSPNGDAQPEQKPVAWEQFYPDIGKPQLEQLPQLSQEVVLQYPKEAVDWQKQQKEYAQQLKVEGPCHVVCQCDKCKAQEQDNAYIYASNLAKTIWQKHYMKESPKFALLDTTDGVLTQIDNMTCGLVREKPAQPEQEPVAWMFQHDETGRMNYVSNDGIHDPTMFLGMNPRYALVCPLYTTPPKRKPLTDEQIDKAMAENKQTLIDAADNYWKMRRAYARIIESAHGIKE